MNSKHTPGIEVDGATPLDSVEYRQAKAAITKATKPAESQS